MVTGFFDPTGLSTSYILLAEIPVRDIAIAATTKQCGGSKCSTEAEGQDNETKKRLDPFGQHRERDRNASSSIWAGLVVVMTKNSLRRIFEPLAPAAVAATGAQMLVLSAREAGAKQNRNDPKENDAQGQF